jgi:hypothetical protein
MIILYSNIDENKLPIPAKVKGEQIANSAQGSVLLRRVQVPLALR